MLTAAISVGVVVSLLVTELTGLVAGGIVVPGYVALLLDRPSALLSVAVVTAATYALGGVVERYSVVYGRRRFALFVVVGLALSGLATVGLRSSPVPYVDWAGIGYVVPGLIAHTMSRQGALRTLLAIAVAAPVVRLVLLLL